MKYLFVFSLIGLASCEEAKGDASAEKKADVRQEGFGLGHIFGEKIDQVRFNSLEAKYGQNTWNYYVDSLIMNKEYDALGLSISDKEFNAYLMADQGFDVLEDLQGFFIDSMTRKITEESKKLGRINNILNDDLDKPAATMVVSGDLFKIYFDKDVDLKLIKENLTSKQNRIQDEMNKISQRLENKSFVDRAPKEIVEQEKTNYNNLKNDIDKISVTIKGI